MSAVVELARFHHAEPLRACTKVLDAAGIPYRLSNDSLTSNVSMMRVAYNATCIVTVKEEDMVAARQALLDEARLEVAAGVPDDHYFATSSNEDLHAVLREPLDWSFFDLAVAEKILRERGAPVVPVSLAPAVPLSLPDAAQGQTLPGRRRAPFIHILGGFVLGGLPIGFLVGLGFISCTEPSPIPGKRQFVYDEYSRRMGMYMVVFCIVVWMTVILLFFMYRASQ